MKERWNKRMHGVLNTSFTWMLFIFFSPGEGKGQPNLSISFSNDSHPQATITFASSPNRFYRLLESSDLKLWIPLQSVGTSSDPSSVTFNVDATGLVTSFFRVEEQVLQPVDHMVWIGPGTFVLGSPPDEVGRYLDKEEPQTDTILEYGYWIAKYEVTQGQFEEMLGFNPSRFKLLDDPELPVESVSWFNALDYCFELTIREQEAGRLPEGYEYRLPTEAEWAYAARAGTTTRFSHGDDPGYELLHEYAWYKGNAGLQPHPVGQKKPNPWGLYDVHGNIFEWCMDWFGDLPGGSVTDYWGPEDGYDRVVRGGYWNSSPAFCRSALRVHHPPESQLSFLGFRVVLSAVDHP